MSPPEVGLLLEWLDYWHAFHWAESDFRFTGYVYLKYLKSSNQGTFFTEYRHDKKKTVGTKERKGETPI